MSGKNSGAAQTIPAAGKSSLATLRPFVQRLHPLIISVIHPIQFFLIALISFIPSILEQFFLSNYSARLGKLPNFDILPGRSPGKISKFKD
jgi:hypothetical protein